MSAMRPWIICCSINTSPTSSGAPRATGASLWPRPSTTASPCRPLALPWDTSTAIARSVYPRTCSRPSGTFSARTPTSVSTSPAYSTPNGWSPRPSRRRNPRSRKNNRAQRNRLDHAHLRLRNNRHFEADPALRDEAEHERRALEGGSEDGRACAAGNFRRLRRACARRINRPVGWLGRIARLRSGLPPLVKIVRLAADELFVGERADLLGLDQDNVFRVLNRSFDDEKRLFRNQKPHPFE